MKKSIDTKLALYPTPVTIVGAMNGDKPTWTLVAHIGIIGHDRILVSLAEPHFINHLIKESGRLDANISESELQDWINDMN
jgi:flavin reductase (DIM6/NTAB) family NADH-FMN oxidoreductase RutF